MKTTDKEMTQKEMTKWVSCWGTATSISDRHESTYARDLTLRYRLTMSLDGSKLRLRFSNQTGTEAVKIGSIRVARVGRDGHHGETVVVTWHGSEEMTIGPTKEETTDEVTMNVVRGEQIDISFHLPDFTQMNSGTLLAGPLSKGKFSYGNHTELDELPMELSRNTGWFYFLNTVDVLTYDHCHALICYGDSITAQSWPDYLTLRLLEREESHVAVIRRAVCGTRILRQYDCITYQAYGLKGATRFPVETNVAVARDVIIQHGINDIIHPVGSDVNPFRPWSDMPTVEELEHGVESLYVSHARNKGLGVWSGTLTPIDGWRTYVPMREEMRKAFNEWLQTSEIFDGCVDFDAAVRDPDAKTKFKEGFDSGDHLHPSEAAYKEMAATVPEELLK